MLTDQGSVFRSEAWKANCECAQISLRHTGSESHNFHGAGETYHEMLSRVINKISMQFPRLPMQLRLPTAVKAVNGTAGPYVLVPSRLLFRSMRLIRYPKLDQRLSVYYQIFRNAKKPYAWLEESMLI